MKVMEVSVWAVIVAILGALWSELKMPTWSMYAAAIRGLLPRIVTLGPSGAPTVATGIVDGDGDDVLFVRTAELVSVSANSGGTT